MRVAAVLIAVTGLAASPAAAAPLIVNEFNAVASGGYLNGGTATMDGEGNTTNLASDTHFGRIAGNGGDWIELVVVADHLDIRGWQLDICEGVTCNDLLVFSNDLVWSDLRAGTVLTVAEDEPTDLGFDMGAGDWWMNVRAHGAGMGTYITASNFPVNQNDWNVTILDAGGEPVFGPIGEHVPITPDCSPPQDDLNSGEIFRLEQAPTALIDPCFKTLNDWEDGVLSSFGEENVWNSGLATQSFANLRSLSPYPDRDGDQVPDDADFSGVAGDNPCSSGATAGCDDNCAGLQNASQADSGGPGGPDGQGDGCQCGDPTGDDDVTAADVLELRELRVGLRSQLTVPERCSVHSNGECTLADLVVLDRTVANPALEPGLQPTCQAGAPVTDQSEFMFDPDRLLEIDVLIARADWDLLRAQELDVIGEIFAPTCGTQPWVDPYTFFPADVTVDGQTLTNVGVRKKGFFGSLSMTMPSLKVKFDEFVGGQQLNSMDRLTLNNNLQDAAHVKQCLAYKVMSEAGVPAPRCNFTHLTVTVDEGATTTVEVDLIYSHVESIKDPFLRRHFGSDQDQGRLYEGTLSDFWPGSYRNTIEPKTLAAAADTTEIDALTTALEDPGLSDAARLAAVQGLVDVDDFLTFWAAEGLVGHWDGYVDDQNNFWFYVDPAPADGLIRFIPWGTDDTWGRGNPLTGRIGDPTHCEAIVPRSALARRLYEIASTNSAYLTELQRQLDDVFDEAAVHAEINRIEALIFPVTGNLTSQLAPIRTFVDVHRARVQAEITSPPVGFSTQFAHFCVLNP